MECTFCGMPLRASNPEVVWSDGEAREPFCDVECEASEIVHTTILAAGNRRRRDWRRMVSAASALVGASR